MRIGKWKIKNGVQVAGKEHDETRQKLAEIVKVLLCVCLICMPAVRLVCMPYMYALYVCLLCALCVCLTKRVRNSLKLARSYDYV